MKQLTKNDWNFVFQKKLIYLNDILLLKTINADEFNLRCEIEAQRYHSKKETIQSFFEKNELDELAEIMINLEFGRVG